MLSFPKALITHPSAPLSVTGTRVSVSCRRLNQLQRASVWGPISLAEDKSKDCSLLAPEQRRGSHECVSLNRWLRGLRARTFCLVVARYDGIQEPTLRTPIKTSEIYALAASNSSLHRNSDSHSGAHWCHHTAKDDFHRGRSTVPRAIRWPTPSCFVGCLQSILLAQFPSLAKLAVQKCPRF